MLRAVEHRNQKLDQAPQGWDYLCNITMQSVLTKEVDVKNVY